MRQASVFTRIALLMMVLAMLPACAAFQGKSGTATPSLKTKLTRLEDRGQVCFRDGGLNSTAVLGTFRPAGCYSSSASRPLEQSLSVKLDADRFRIEFHTSFLVETILDVIHTTDCGGAGEMSFEIGDVEPGVYSIWIGNKRVGELTLPSTGGAGNLCFGEE
jgi:hypothetical protein